MRKYYRKYITIKCPICGKERLIRKDNSTSGKCQPCASKTKWLNIVYRETTMKSHKGKRLSTKTKLKISKSLKKSPMTDKRMNHLKDLWEKRTLRKGIASARHLFNCYKTSAKKRRYGFGLSFNEFVKITSRNCCYCGKKPALKRKPNDNINGEYVYNGIDRIDNEAGYTSKNSVPCCTHCNYAKHKMTVREFRDWIIKVYKNYITTN